MHASSMLRISNINYHNTFFYTKIFEDTKGESRIRKSKKDRQHNGQKKIDKRTNNDLQNTTQKTKDGTTQTPLSFLKYIKINPVHYIN
jgi:hypothetical protein